MYLPTYAVQELPGSLVVLPGMCSAGTAGPFLFDICQQRIWEWNEMTIGIDTIPNETNCCNLLSNWLLVMLTSDDTKPCQLCQL